MKYFRVARIAKNKIFNLVKNSGKYLLGVPVLHDTSMLSNNSLEESIVKLKKKYILFKPTLVKFLIEFFRYLQHLEATIPTYQEKNLLFIHCCCWSDSYTEKMINCFFPSLLANNNLPHIYNNKKIIILIHCDQKTKLQILNSSVYKEINKYASFDFYIIPEKLLTIYKGRLNFLEKLLVKKYNILESIKYFLLGGLQTHALKIALSNKVYISFMMPDVIISDGFLSEMIYQGKDKKVVVSTTYRTNYHKVCEQVEKFYDSHKKNTLSISATALSELQIENIHEAARRRIISEKTLNFSPCAQLIFEAERGFVIRSFHYHPVLINCALISPDIKMDYLPIDNSVLNQIISNDVPLQEQVGVCNDSTKSAWVELSDDNIEQNFAEKSNFTRDELVAIIKKMITKQPEFFDTPLNQYYFSIRNEVFSDKIIHDNLSISDIDFASDLKTH